MSWQKIFPELKDPELMGLIEHHGKLRKFKAGEYLISPGQRIDQIPLVIEGSLKISREDNDGRELLLYYLHEGDTCAASLNCCMAASGIKLSAVAETNAEVLFFPSRFLEAWMEEYPCWRLFIMGTFQKRFDELLQTLDQVAFQRMDERIQQYLNEKTIVYNSQQLPITHQKIAEELHSTREVISRLLKQMEKKGLIKLGRNMIEVL